ncbi:ABC transporter permease [Candidatus Aerophobetes bacterium]|uniref:ABC transporter permease subunit n=1 Tax=Aerophobetes bacterium TaxID=2030807 RepID=A0A7V5HZS8_UNCAE|nr:ABC transporter permease [Candidatus Aerophobetes bacterium]HHF97867.1 ABC transporter permease subunit [Candidatus Aerophobetes bacterium]
MERRKEFFSIVAFICGALVICFLTFPLLKMFTSSSLGNLVFTLRDKEVLESIWRSLYTAFIAGLISFLVGTPFAYLLARRDFFGKKIIESVIDLPMVIPHPVVGIAILSVVGKDYWFGRVLSGLGIRVMGSILGIVVVLTFVGMPFYINSAKNGFKSVPSRLEKVSRSLGASFFSTFLQVTFPLAWKSMLVGVIMCCARAISEFGAVVVVAYHPMVAPVLIYERFEAYGLSYSQPVAVLLTLFCLVLFLILRIFSMPESVKR